MFELIILITFVLWCVFGGLLLKHKRAAARAARR